MSGFLQTISIKNFKAFENFDFQVNGKNLLIYGENGSGKSSLYYALYTFLQSAGKETDEVAKYFDENRDENLLHRKLGLLQTPGEISLGIGESLEQITNHKISQSAHETPENTILTNANLSSDFITYRFFFGFSDFLNSERFNIWPLFEKEIMPFAQKGSEAQGELLKEWKSLYARHPNPRGHRGRAGAKAYRDYNNRHIGFCNSLSPLLDNISNSAQEIYDRYFEDPKLGTVKLGFIITRPSSFNKPKKEKHLPHLELQVTINDKIIQRPQSFFNEAKMTQIALAFRLGATRAKVTNELQILAIDDLLVSLDMENRGVALRMLLSEDFESYQKIIFTHDLGFFEDAKRRIAVNHTDWQYLKFEAEEDRPCLNVSKTDLQKAEDFFENNQLEECGNRLRKYVEANLTTFLARMRESGFESEIHKKNFSSLHSMLIEAKSALAQKLSTKLRQLIDQKIPDEVREAIFSAEEFDPSNPEFLSNLNRDERGILIRKVIGLQPEFWTVVLELFTDYSKKIDTANKILDEIVEIKDRVLNPTSHALTSPVYSSEAEDSIKVIHRLQTCLAEVLAEIEQE